MPSTEGQDFDFGTIAEDDGPATTLFRVTNTGKTPLLIKTVEVGCGCTTPEWPKSAIMPGEKGVVKVQYNPKDRLGPFVKTVSVYTNQGVQPILLTIRGKVVEGGSVKGSKRFDYVQSFPANEKAILLSDQRFQTFMDSVAAIASPERYVSFAIESSASKVPTKTYGSNEELARVRALEAREKIEAALQKRKIPSAQYRFVQEKSLIQGPAWDPANKTRMAVYEPFQYVKIIAQ